MSLVFQSWRIKDAFFNFHSGVICNNLNRILSLNWVRISADLETKFQKLSRKRNLMIGKIGTISCKDLYVSLEVAWKIKLVNWGAYLYPWKCFIASSVSSSVYILLLFTSFLFEQSNNDLHERSCFYNVQDKSANRSCLECSEKSDARKWKELNPKQGRRWWLQGKIRWNFVLCLWLLPLRKGPESCSCGDFWMIWNVVIQSYFRTWTPDWNSKVPHFSLRSIFLSLTVFEEKEKQKRFFRAVRLNWAQLFNFIFFFFQASFSTILSIWTFKLSEMTP